MRAACVKSTPITRLFWCVNRMDFYLVTYDVSNNRRRTKLANLLEDYGKRVQESVFEIWLTPAHLRELQKRMKKFIKPEEDNVRMYHLCQLCCDRVQVIGEGPVPAPPTSIII